MTLRLARRNRTTPLNHLVAADVMTTNAKSIGREATMRDTAEFFLTHGIHTAPVIDDAGRPLGVVSRTDLLDYWGRRRDRLAAIANDETTVESPESGTNGTLNVVDIMTPVVFCVPAEAPIGKVIEKALALEVRCLFVTDEHGVLVGVISVFDLLRTSAGPKQTQRAGTRSSSQADLTIAT